MKKISCMILVFVLISALFACAPQEQTDTDRLNTILDTIADDEDITKLDAVKYTGQLAAFLKSSELTTEETLDIVKPWLTAQAPEVRARLRSQLENLGAYLQDGAAQIQNGLADGSLQEKAQSILSSIAASGGIG